MAQRGADSRVCHSEALPGFLRSISAVAIRGLLLLASLTASALAADFVHAVEFPYAEFPRPLWERELVWLKNVGVRTVVFSIPAHAAPGDPRADLPGFLRLLRQLGMRAWIRGIPKELAASLEIQSEKHGGPIAYVEGGGSDAPAPPGPVVRISAVDSNALLKSREALARAPGSLVWTDVEDTLAAGFHSGAVSFSGDERPAASVLRRSVALLKIWGPALPPMRQRHEFKGGIPAVQISVAAAARGPSAVSVSNPAGVDWHGDVTGYDAGARRKLVIPGVSVPAGDTMWLPVNIPLAAGGFCEDWAALAPQDRIVYATAELNGVEYENGILALEFAAPASGAVVLQLSRRPTGPLLAGGKPTDFEWDEEQHTIRLPIPAGKAPLYRVRIGLALEPPEQSGFFADPAQRLILGQTTIVPAAFSSEELAARARLIAPPNYRSRAIVKSPLEIEYEVTPPVDAAHGEFVRLALEADGVHLAHGRMQVMRPASLRLLDAPPLHFGMRSALALEPAVIAVDPRAGRALRVLIRNNSPGIQNFILAASGDGVTFSPPRTEISVAAKAEREVSLRIFIENTAAGTENRVADGSAEEGSAGLRDARLRLSGAAAAELAVRLLPLRRGETAVYSLDRDGDGVPDWILENSQTRATFSGSDARWLEWVWKDGEINLLPESGALAMHGATTVRPIAGGIEVAGVRVRRTIRLGDTLDIAQEGGLALDGLRPDSRDGLAFGIEKASPDRTIFSLRRGK